MDMVKKTGRLERKMKKFISQVFVYLILGIGMPIIGLLLVPAGALMILASIVLRGIDRLIRFLEEKGNGRGKLRETVASEPEVTEMAAQWEEC